MFVDIRGISTFICMHHILFKYGAKLTRQHQIRLNPLFIKMVKEEISKLLDAKITFLILDSRWVSHGTVILKNIGVIVVTNQNNELILIRV